MTDVAREGGTVAPQWAVEDEPGGSIVGLAERVRQLRKQHGWSQAELAERIGADPAQISRYEGGRITPSAEAVVKLAEVFDVSCDYLLVDDAPRRPFRSADDALGDRLAKVAELTDEDLVLVTSFIDALATKSRLKALAGEIA
jgi:transcriptional regulator with XRE-family HTH domain